MEKNRVLTSVRLKPENLKKAQKIALKNKISLGLLFDSLIENTNLKNKL